MNQIIHPVDERDYSLDLAGAFAITSISLSHAINVAYDVYGDQYLEFITTGVWAQIIKAVLRILSQLGVPLFLMLTGILILRKNILNNKAIHRYYTRNFGGILITSEIWMFIIFIIKISTQYSSFYSGLVSLNTLNIIKDCFLNQLFINQNTFGSIWYIPMILAVYTVLPVVNLAIHSSKSKLVILVPLLLVFFVGYIIPDINTVFRLAEIPFRLNMEFLTSNVFSEYLVYVLCGYYLFNYFNSEYIKRIPTLLFLLVAILSFSCSAYIQFIGFSKEFNFLIDYCNCFVLIPSLSVFCLILRVAPLLKRVKKSVTFLSKASFGIYFIHRVYVHFYSLYLNPVFSSRFMNCMFIWLSSLVISLIVIFPTWNILWLSRPLYMRK